MKLMILITDKGKSNQVVDFMASLNLTTAVTFIGKGTATHEILETLSLTQEDKEVVMGFADGKDIKNIFQKLEEDFGFTRKGMGVACSVNLNGITAKTLNYIQSSILTGDK